jgi:2-keto-4-pentenoate hydratase/2-oxohepta-3-ene-1,7-dioic acid hydratase in catechol pathway
MKHAVVNFEGERYNAVEQNGQLLLIDGAMGQIGRLVDFDAVQWLPPLAATPRPRTILALGLNYADHAKELEFKAPEEPLVFIKGEDGVVDCQPGDVIVTEIEGVGALVNTMATLSVHPEPVEGLGATIR